MTFDSNHDRLTAYALGELEGEERDGVEALLARDEDARRAVEEIRATAAALARSLKSEPAPRLTPVQRRLVESKIAGEPERAPVLRRLWPWWLVGGSLAAGLLVMALLPSMSTAYKARSAYEGGVAIAPDPSAAGSEFERGFLAPPATALFEHAPGPGARGGVGPFDGEGYAEVVDNPFVRPLGRDALSTFSIDVDTASYANVRRFIRGGALPVRGAVRIEELINYFAYDYAAPASDSAHPIAAHVEVGPCPWWTDHRLVRIGLKAREGDLSNRPPTSIVFLLDVSGSMQPQNKLPLLKRAFRLLVDQLAPDDRVSIVVYAGAAGLVLPPTWGYDREAILDALGSLEAGGSTNGGAGIHLAYQIAEECFVEGGINRVIIATDGDFNVGTTSDDALERLIEAKRRTGVFLSVLGFGEGNLQDAKMERLADRGNGHYAYIDSIEEARKVLVDELGGTLVTIAKDVKIQVEFNPARVAAYRLIGYENRLLRAEDFRDDTKDAGEIGAGHTVTALYEVVPPGVEIGGPVVDSLRYQRDEIDSANAPGATELRDELLMLKLAYKLPEGETSSYVEVAVADVDADLAGDLSAELSADSRFAAAVASFGMILRDSPYKGDATFESVLALARPTTGTQRPMAAWLLENCLDYLGESKPDLAAANARALLSEGLSDAELAALASAFTTHEHFDRLSARRMVPGHGSENPIAELAARIDRGRRDAPDAVRRARALAYRQEFVKLVERAKALARGAEAGE